MGPAGLQRTNGMPDPITIHHCIGWDSSADPSACTVSESPQSYLLTINGFYTNPFINPGNTLGSLSRCVTNVKSLLTGFNTGVKLPLFESIEAPIPMTIVAHSDFNCVTPTKTFNLNGIGDNIHTGHSRNDLVFDNSLASICESGAFNFPFAEGAYTASGTNYICTADQFNEIGGPDFVTYKAGTFALASNLDFSTSTFVGIGSFSTAFTGTLNGNNFTMSNISYTAGDAKNGVIRWGQMPPRSQYALFG